MYPPPDFPPEAPESLAQKPGSLTDALGALWRDRLYQALLALALLANLALLTYLAVRYNNLPDRLPLHYDSFGQPDRIEYKNAIFALPIIGVTVFFMNLGLGVLLHRRERAATLVLAIGALFVQVLMWLAVINVAGLV